MSKRNGPKEYYCLYKDDYIFYLISYGLTQINEDLWTWNELYFFKDKYPTISIDTVKKAIIGDIDKDTDTKILTGYVWNNLPVRLRQEDQFNYKAAYDLAVQTDGANLPIKFKLGDTPITWENIGTEEEPEWVEKGGEPIYHTFETIEEITDFYTKAVAHINNCLNEGWQKKDSIDWSEYEEALKPKTTEE